MTSQLPKRDAWDWRDSPAPCAMCAGWWPLLGRWGPVLRCRLLRVLGWRHPARVQLDPSFRDRPDWTLRQDWDAMVSWVRIEAVWLGMHLRCWSLHLRVLQVRWRRRRMRQRYGGRWDGR